MRDDREKLRAGCRCAIFEIGCGRGFGVGRGGDWVNLQGAFTIVLTAREKAFGVGKARGRVERGESTEASARMNDMTWLGEIAPVVSQNAGKAASNVDVAVDSIMHAIWRGLMKD